LTARTPNGKYTEIDDSGNEKIPMNSAIPDVLAKTDYAINAGTAYVPGTSPPNPPPNAAPPLATSCGGPGPFPNCVSVATDLAAIGSVTEKAGLLFNGISTRYVGATLRQITDGTSKTALVGEKALPPKYYTSGYGDKLPAYSGNGGDNSSMYQGHDKDNARYIGGKPVLDDDVESSDVLFGGPHVSSMHMAMSDGSVHSIDYDIDQEVWGLYGSRHDGKSEYDKP
jgi:hypothetical protein